MEIAGYRVIDAPSASAALAVLEQNPGKVDLLVTDLTLPDMLGTDLAAQLVMRQPLLRVVVMSGADQLPSASTPSMGSKPRFLQKPFMFPELVKVVGEVLADEAPDRTG